MAIIKVNGDKAKVLEKSVTVKYKKYKKVGGVLYGDFAAKDEVLYVEFVSGKHTDRRAIIQRKNGKYSIFKLFLVFFIGICLNLLDMDTIRTQARYARKPAIAHKSSEA